MASQEKVLGTCPVKLHGGSKPAQRDTGQAGQLGQGGQAEQDAAEAAEVARAALARASFRPCRVCGGTWEPPELMFQQD